MESIRLFEEVREEDVLVKAPYVFSLTNKPYVPSKKTVTAATVTIDDKVIEDGGLRCATFSIGLRQEVEEFSLDDEGNTPRMAPPDYGMDYMRDEDNNVYLHIVCARDMNPFSEFKCDCDKIQYYEVTDGWSHKKCYLYGYKLTDAENASFNSDERDFMNNLPSMFPTTFKAYFEWASTTVPRNCFGVNLVELCDGALDDIEVIDSAAFAKTRLETISLPSTLKTIGNEAFCGAYQLEEVEYNGKVYEEYSMTKEEYFESKGKLDLYHEFKDIMYVAWSDLPTSFKEYLVSNGITEDTRFTSEAWNLYYNYYREIADLEEEYDFNKFDKLYEALDANGVEYENISLGQGCLA